jgi:hypothetical protein
MIKIKEIIWVEQEVECYNSEKYYDGMINDIQFISISKSYDNSNNFQGYSVYSHLVDKGFDRDNIYKTVNDAKLVANKKVEDFILSLIDMRDYKINELLNKKED